MMFIDVRKDKLSAADTCERVR